MGGDVTPWVGPLVGASFGVLGLLIVSVGLWYLARDRAIGRWPKVPGTVTASRYECFDRTSRDANGYDVSWTTFTPVVTYQYTVAGQTLSGAKVTRAMQPTMNAGSVKACIDRYPRGARIEVFYDPADPATAFLETGTSAGAVFLVVFGGFFAVMGFGIVALVLHNR